MKTLERKTSSTTDTNVISLSPNSSGPQQPGQICGLTAVYPSTTLPCAEDFWWVLQPCSSRSRRQPPGSASQGREAALTSPWDVQTHSVTSRKSTLNLSSRARSNIIAVVLEIWPKRCHESMLLIPLCTRSRDPQFFLHVLVMFFLTSLWKKQKNLIKSRSHSEKCSWDLTTLCQ